MMVRHGESTDKAENALLDLQELEFVQSEIKDVSAEIGRVQADPHADPQAVLALARLIGAFANQLSGIASRLGHAVH